MNVNIYNIINEYKTLNGENKAKLGDQRLVLLQVGGFYFTQRKTSLMRIE